MAKRGFDVAWDDEFIFSEQVTKHDKKMRAFTRQNVLFEYACSDTSIIGQVSSEIGVKCLRLSRSTLDLCNHAHIQQAVDQAAALEGADAGISIECTQYSPIQNLNAHMHGKPFQTKLAQSGGLRMPSNLPHSSCRIMGAWCLSFQRSQAFGNWKNGASLPRCLT